MKTNEEDKENENGAEGVSEGSKETLVPPETNPDEKSDP